MGGLVTEITCSFGVNGAKSDGQRLLNNALRLKRNKIDDVIPISLMKVIDNSNFHIIEKIQQQFTEQDMFVLQNECNFQGLNAVYDHISKQLEQILSTSFDSISSQIQNGTQHKIDALTCQKNKCLQEIENMKTRYKEMNLPETVIQQTQAAMLEHVQTLQKQIDGWKKQKNDTVKLVASKN